MAQAMNTQPIIETRAQAWAAFLVMLLVGLFAYELRAVDYFSAVVGNLGDARFNIAILEYNYQWIQGRWPSLWSPPFFYPFEGVLAFSDNHLGSTPIYSFFRLFGLDRETAFSAWFVTGGILNYVAAFVVLRRLGFASASAAIGGFVYAFALPALAREGHAQLTYRFAVPFAFLAVRDVFEQRRLFPLWRASLWTSLQFFCSIYIGVFLLYLLIAVSIAFFAIGRWRDLPAIFRSLSNCSPPPFQGSSLVGAAGNFDK